MSNHIAENEVQMQQTLKIVSDAEVFKEESFKMYFDALTKQRAARGLQHQVHHDRRLARVEGEADRESTCQDSQHGRRIREQHNPAGLRHRPLQDSLQRSKEVDF